MSAALRGMPFGIDTANHAGIRIRGYTAEQVAPLLAQSAAYEALVAEIEAAPIFDMHIVSDEDGEYRGAYFGTPSDPGQRVRLLLVREGSDGK